MWKYKKLSSCRGCGRTGLVGLLDLGKIPLPNEFLTQADLKKKESLFPLEINLCKNCGMVQLGHAVNPELMFRKYSYVPSTSPLHLKHFEELSSEILSETNTPQGSLVVDIGSNDGSLLKTFQAKSMQVLGIDPARNIAKIARENGVPTVNDYFSLQVAEKILSKQGNAEVMTMTNALAHVNDIHSVFSGISKLLSDTGVFVAEFPYLLDMVKKTLFDTIYHEHLSYLSVSSLLPIAQMHDMYIFKVKSSLVDGGALKVYFKRSVGRVSPHSTVAKFLQKEELFGVKKPSSYKDFVKRVEKIRTDLVKKVRFLKKNNFTVGAYGAPAKGNILLNYCKLSPKDIAFILDKNPLKQNKFAPGSHIPVLAPTYLENHHMDYLVLLAWNFFKEVMEEQEAFRRKGGKFIIPLPHLKII